MNEYERKVVRAVISVLTPDLKHPNWQDGVRGPNGHCYHASEAVYHLLGGSASGYVPHYEDRGGATHWYLVHQSGRVLDVTDGDWEGEDSEHAGFGEPKPFYTAWPSKRAAEVIRRVKSRGFLETWMAR